MVVPYGRLIFKYGNFYPPVPPPAFFGMVIPQGLFGAVPPDHYPFRFPDLPDNEVVRHCRGPILGKL
jgi:hypothetical protein